MPTASQAGRCSTARLVCATPGRRCREAARDSGRTRIIGQAKQRSPPLLRILGRANSFNVRKVLWICDEIGIPFQREDWGRGYTPTSSPEFLEINPIGLIPAVIDDGVVLRESNA